MADLSIDLGQVPLGWTSARLTEHFEQVRRDVARFLPSELLSANPSKKPGRQNTSVCLLLDDTVRETDKTPVQAIAGVMQAAEAANLREIGLYVNYIGRLSGLSARGVDGTHSLASLALHFMHNMPKEGETGSSIAWVTDSLRVDWPVDPSTPRTTRPGRLVAVREGEGRERRWTKEFLGAVWCLARHGALEEVDSLVPARTDWQEEKWKDYSWDSMPTLIKMQPSARPFGAHHGVTYRTPNTIGTESILPIMGQYASRSYVDWLRSVRPDISPDLLDRHTVITIGSSPERTEQPLAIQGATSLPAAT